jgi:hypothetical protein
MMPERNAFEFTNKPVAKMSEYSRGESLKRGYEQNGKINL